MNKDFSRREFGKKLLKLSAGAMLFYNIQFQKQIFAEEKQNNTVKCEMTIGELAESISHDLVNTLGKDTKWYAKPSSIDSKVKVLLFSDRHDISGPDKDNEFRNIIDILSRYTKTFYMEGVGENAKDPMKSFFYMNKVLLPEDYNLDTCINNMKKYYKSWYKIAHSGMKIHGLENHQLYHDMLLTTEIIGNLQVLKKTSNDEIREIVRTNLNFLYDGISNKVFIIRDFNEKIVDIATLPNFDDMSLSDQEEISNYFLDIHDYFLQNTDKRSIHSVNILRKIESGTIGLFYGALHRNMVKKGLEHNKTGYIDICNSDIDQYVENLLKAHEFMSNKRKIQLDRDQSFLFNTEKGN